MLAFVTGPAAAATAVLNSSPLFHALSLVMTGMTLWSILPHLWPKLLSALYRMVIRPHFWLHAGLAAVYLGVGALALCGVGWFPHVYNPLADACRQLIIALQQVL